MRRDGTGAAGTPLVFLNGIGADIAAAAPLLARISGREVWTLDIEGEEWGEVDFPADVETARALTARWDAARKAAAA